MKNPNKATPRVRASTAIAAGALVLLMASMPTVAAAQTLTLLPPYADAWTYTDRCPEGNQDELSCTAHVMADPGGNMTAQASLGPRYYFPDRDDWVSAGAGLTAAYALDRPVSRLDILATILVKDVTAVAEQKNGGRAVVVSDLWVTSCQEQIQSCLGQGNVQLVYLDTSHPDRTIQSGPGEYTIAVTVRPQWLDKVPAGNHSVHVSASGFLETMAPRNCLVRLYPLCDKTGTQAAFSLDAQLVKIEVRPHGGQVRPL